MWVSSIIEVALIGNPARDAELRHTHTGDGHAAAGTRLATDRLRVVRNLHERYPATMMTAALRRATGVCAWFDWC